jgi:hypothetical protein
VKQTQPSTGSCQFAIKMTSWNSIE